MMPPKRGVAGLAVVGSSFNSSTVGGTAAFAAPHVRRASPEAPAKRSAVPTLRARSAVPGQKKSEPAAGKPSKKSPKAVADAEFSAACEKLEKQGLKKPGPYTDETNAMCNKWRTSAAEFWDSMREKTQHHPLCSKIRKLIPERAAVSELDSDGTVQALNLLVEEGEAEVRPRAAVTVTVTVKLHPTVRSVARWTSRGSNRSSALCSTRLMR